MNKNFMARISAIITDFQRNIRKAQRMAKTEIPDEIETQVDANISKFKRALNTAKAMAQRWREHTVDIDGNANPVKRAIAVVREKLQQLRDKEVDIKGNNNPLKRSVLGAKAMLATLHDKTVHVNFDTRGMTRAQVLTRALGQSLDEYGDKMDALATKIRTFGTVFGQQIKGMLIASFQGLIPIIAGLVPAIMAVANALGVVAGGALGVAGAFGIAASGAFAFGAMAVSAIKMLNDGTLQATAQTRRYQASLEQVKSTWEGIIKQNQAQIFNTLSNALDTVNVALGRMKPFLAGISKGMEQASQSVLKWAQNSQTASKFFNMMNTTGVKTFNTLLSAAGRFGDGLINVFTQLGPLFLWTAKGLDNLGKKFQNWANSVAGQNAIKSFIEYTQTNLPKIGQIFGNVFMGIGNLMKAFAQNSSNIFDWLVKMTAKFREWSEQVGKSEGFKKFVQYVQENGPVIMDLIGNIVRVLVAFGTAMAPIASVILKVVTALAGFIAKLFETHPAIARMVGIGMILGGMLWALLAPIIAVSTVLSNVFGVGLIQAIGKMLAFARNTQILRSALNLVKIAFRLLMSPISTIMRILPMLSGAFQALGVAIGAISWPVLAIIGVIVALIGIIVWLWKTNENFRKTCIEAWNTIKDTIMNAVKSVINWFNQFRASIQQTLQPIIPILQMLGQVANQVLGFLFISLINGVVMAFQYLWTIVSVVFTAIGGILQAASQLFIGLATAWIQLLSGDIPGAWQTLQTMTQNVMNTIWNTILSIWNQISNFIFNVLNRILGTNITSWNQIWSAISGAVTRIWNTVASWFSRVVSTVAQKMMQALSRIISGGAQWVSSIISAMSRFLQAVVSGFFRVVGAVGNGMRNALNRARSFIGHFYQVGVDMIAGMIRGIVQKAKDLAAAAWNAAKGALNAAKSALDSHSPSRKFIQLGNDSMTGLGMGISEYAGKAARESKLAALKVMDAFNADLKPDFLEEGLAGLGNSFDAHMSKDVRHSMQENNKPIVNVTVRNESDIPAIKSYIEDSNSKDASFGLF
ncbi:terminase [Staphylococcus sp. HMSC075A04]|uniref:phage tail protein n=1 Tax=Staphylococcus sp. HMSC075A04 TaxID=1739249 RepID=UPI0008A5AF7D|nr:terminase [Staphylococcus sp. HMSC075A04]MCG2092645.1 terminase [Staphylococcus epidermidis]MCG2264625.1 terminase [Staphylococcus epidermidis]OFL83748.1 terminase [Staphylococcus sp. HMSC075A04]